MSDATDDERYDRQIRLFGEEGQRRLADATVVVIGLGGLGSHVCQQLAYLGVKRFELIDHDTIDRTNLNRLIGALESDIGSYKTAVAKRMIETIQPDAVVSTLEERIPCDSLSTRLTGVRVIVGCLDNDYPRLKLTELSAQCKLAYVDAASDILNEGKIYGGRVYVADERAGCLSCEGELDQNEIRRAQMTDDELEVEARMYGVPVTELRGTGPSVVTINGVVASLAATEVMAVITGLRKPVKRQTYRAHLGQITFANEPAESDCYYCSLRRV